jgi:thioredoxin reductase
MPRSGLPRIAVLGAGPIGLEAALYARTLDYPVTVYEAGHPGEYVRRWGHVRLFSPFAMNSTPLGRAAVRSAGAKELPGDGECITGREHLARYLEPLARSDVLKDCIQPESQVIGVTRRGLLKGELIGDTTRTRQPFRLLLRDSKKQERIAEADVVLDCTGTYGYHRWLGTGGIPALGELATERQISYHLEDILGERKNHYAGRTTVVIGSGYSAATTVCQLAELAEQNANTWVIWLARRAGTQPLLRITADPLKERDRLAARANTLATRNDGNVEFHAATNIEVVEGSAEHGFKVTANCGGQARTWQVERIIANVGYTPNRDLYRELQVHECYASLGPMKLAAAILGQAGGDCLKQVCPGADTLRNPEPNFFILGAKSYGRNSHFLLRIGFEQVREVFTLITGKPGLDLYK